MFLESDVKLDYSDVLLVPENSDIVSRADVDLFNDDGVIPIIAANMDGVGTFEMAIELAKFGMMTALVKHYSIDELVKFYTQNTLAHLAIYSMGTNDADLKKFQIFHDETKNRPHYPHYICIDVANGYTKNFIDFCRVFRENFTGYNFLIAGNVVTPYVMTELFNVGVDIVKIGIGPGSVCTTRTVTGVGYPQFSAIMECAAVARAWNKKIIADGGCMNPGDVAKAFAGGAHYVMLGGMLAGHDEGGGLSL